jgi:putative hydrolase of HD superfamily
MEFARFVGQLKETPRAGWILRGIETPESVADHSYRMSMMALFLLDSIEGVDALRAAQIALVHDLAEAEVGDITPFDGISIGEKHRRERSAMKKCAAFLSSKSSATKLLTLYEEYEAGESTEARYVKDLDKIDMLLQADEYERDCPPIDLSAFFEGTRGKLKTTFGKTFLAKLEDERNQRLEVEAAARAARATKTLVFSSAVAVAVAAAFWLKKRK